MTSTSKWELYWAPSAQYIATVEARTASAAKRKAPAPYRRYLGEIRAEKMPQCEHEWAWHPVYNYMGIQVGRVEGCTKCEENR